MAYDSNCEKFYVAILHTNVDGVDYYRPIGTHNYQKKCSDHYHNGILKKFGRPHKVFLLTAIEMEHRGYQGELMARGFAVIMRRAFRKFCPGERHWFQLTEKQLVMTITATFPEHFGRAVTTALDKHIHEKLTSGA